jgi:cytochrome c553
MSAKSSSVVLMLAATAFLATIAAAATPAAAQAAPPVKPPAIAQTCAACHGSKGVSTIKDTPSLAAQPDIFTQYQLVFMRDGQRKPGVMQAVVKNLTDENIRDLGAYYAALPPPPPLASKADATRRISPARARAPGWPGSGRNISKSPCTTIAPGNGAGAAWAP